MRIGRVYSKSILPALAVVLLYSAAPAKERSTEFGGWDIVFRLSGGFIHQNYDVDNPPKIRLPGYLEEERYNSKMAGYYSLLRKDILTDNPLVHGAAYADMVLSARNAGFGLSCELITEHRGASYGTYAMSDIAIVPKYFVSIDTSFTIANQLFFAGVEAGNYDDHRLYEGLTIYNIDVQAYHLYLKWKNLKLGLSNIGDMGVGTGLNINDHLDYTVSLEGLEIFETLKIDASAGYFDYRKNKGYESGLPGNGMNLSIGIGWRETARLYSQVGIRNINDSSYGGIKRCGSLIGCAARGRLDMFDFDLTAEYRYYGRYFNLDLKDSGGCFFYRGYDGYGNGCSSWNTVGEQLYPLNMFFRPFSQWAVYTDYQGRDVQSFIFRAEASYELPGNCEMICNLDFNYIDASNEDSFIYPFYDVGFGWAPVNGISITLRHTNRAMNLDRHYPTLYLLQKSILMTTVEGAISF